MTARLWPLAITALSRAMAFSGSSRYCEPRQPVPHEHPQRERRLLFHPFPTAVADMPVEPRDLAVRVGHDEASRPVSDRRPSQRWLRAGRASEIRRSAWCASCARIYRSRSSSAMACRLGLRSMAPIKIVADRGRGRPDRATSAPSPRPVETAARPSGGCRAAPLGPARARQSARRAARGRTT